MDIVESLKELDLNEYKDKVPTGKIESYMISMTKKIYNDNVGKVKGVTDGIETKYFDAVKGVDLDDFVNSKNVTIKGKKDIMSGYRTYHTDLTGKNALGCYLSHVSLWLKVVKEGLEGMYVFESDANCVSIPDKYMEYFKNSGGDILFMGSIEYNPQNLFTNFTKLEDNGIRKLNGHFMATHAYYITYQGAIKCLRHAFPIESQVDGYLSFLIIMGMINVYNVGPHPYPCCQSAHLSSIQTTGVVILDKAQSYTLITSGICIFLFILLIFIIVIASIRK